MVLDGVLIDRPAVVPGGTLTLTLNRRTLSAGTAERVFVHALGDAEHQWAQADVPIGNATTTHVELVFDPQTPPGTYPLELGVYPGILIPLSYSLVLR